MIIEGDFGKIEPKPKEIIQQIYDNTERLNGLVNDFLDVSRIERGKLVMERQMTDIPEMVQSIVYNFQPVVKTKGLTLTYNPPKEAIPKINVDANKLRQVILNLTDNAIKYTPTGSITVTLEALGDHLRCSVKDTGVGLDPEQAKNLFKPFSRATDASKTNATGTGLGLYVAKKIIEYHGGKAWAESEGKGKGSTFIIEMPYDQSNVPEPEPEPYLE
jgi:signal transduction histidine kinase